MEGQRCGQGLLGASPPSLPPQSCLAAQQQCWCDPPPCPPPAGSSPAPAAKSLLCLCCVPWGRGCGAEGTVGVAELRGDPGGH